MTSVLTKPQTSAAAHTASQVEDLVRSHLPLVGHLVREVVSRVPSHVNRDDLTSAGMYALTTSARSFDPTLGVPFRSFASLRIRGALTDEMRSIDWASRSVRSKGRAIEQARQSLMQAFGRTPTDSEVAAQLHMTPAEVADVRCDLHRAALVASDALPQGQGPDALADDAAGPESSLLHSEELGHLRVAIAELPERLRTVVEQYFFAQRLMSDIARDLGVTESRVSQLRTEALSLLRLGMTVGEDSSEPVDETRKQSRAQQAYRAAVANRAQASARPNQPLRRVAG